jgi:hypothetical protein
MKIESFSGVYDVEHPTCCQENGGCDENVYESLHDQPTVQD